MSLPRFDGHPRDVDQTQPLGPEDRIRAERILWRAERLAEAEVKAIDAAYPGPPTEPPAFKAAQAVAGDLIQALEVGNDAAALSERIDDIAVWVCGTHSGALDFIHNFGPETTVIRTIHNVWSVALLGDRLPPQERDILTASWRVVSPEPAPAWFGPRTREVEAVLAEASQITLDQALRLAERWVPGEDRGLHEQLQHAGPSIRARRYSYAGHLASGSVTRALCGRVNDFDRVPLGDPRRLASYLVGRAAMAECLRDAVPPELIERLEEPWRAIIAGTSMSCSNFCSNLGCRMMPPGCRSLPLIRAGKWGGLWGSNP